MAVKFVGLLRSMPIPVLQLDPVRTWLWSDPPPRLVIGNHDVDDFEQLGRAGFGRQYAAAVCDTSPVLVLTHVPLRRIPPTAVNVHGHLHAQPAPTGRYRNVSVELTGYAPVHLEEVLGTAAG